MVIAKERVLHVTLMQDMEIDKLQVKSGLCYSCSARCLQLYHSSGMIGERLTRLLFSGMI